MEKNRPYYGKSRNTKFPGSCHTMGFVAFFCTMENWWGIPCISYLMKYKWESYGESYGEKAPILWKKYEYQFPSSPHAMGFCYIFPYYEKLMGKPVHFPYNKVYHRMGIYEKKAPILWEKYEYQFTRLSPYHGFCCIFPYCGKFMWKPMHSSYDDIG